MIYISITRIVRCSTGSLRSIYNQDEKVLVDYDELDEVSDDGGTAAAAAVIPHQRHQSAAAAAPAAAAAVGGGCCRSSTRFHVALLSSIGFCISFGIRCNMGVAILQMTSNVTRWTVTPLVLGNITVELVSGCLLFRIERLNIICVVV